jgi:hypothetical protein
MQQLLDVIRHRGRIASFARIARIALIPVCALASMAATSRPGASAGAKTASKPRWQIISDANDVRRVAYDARRIYAATGGGVVAWDRGTGKLVRKWTTLDGLLGTSARAIAVCPLPEPKLVGGHPGRIERLRPRPADVGIDHAIQQRADGG